MNETLNELRPRMMSVAYRMLGSVADAEDAVQDAFLSLQSAAAVTSPAGFLVKTTTRRCIDRLRSQRRRAKHIGPWLSAAVDANDTSPTQALTEALGQAFRLMLERLTRDERATFLLRTAFGYKFSEIAEVLGRAECHVRQIFRRANARLRLGRRRFKTSSDVADTLAERFVIACRSGDVSSIEQLFTGDPDASTDGRGEARAARPDALGRNRTGRFLAGVCSRYQRDSPVRQARL